jgi:hypothetical protein
VCHGRRRSGRRRWRYEKSFVKAREIDALRKEQRHKQERNHDRGLGGERRSGMQSALIAIA